ncbi:nucleotide exchange factor GrpE [Nocardioides psychrotolerans]|uniref:nucleotide exchange factor GrpE n=1 Tax=Nocardioides psychrotolerans TaxID=1005945 RepID=UPI00313777D5
MTPEEGAADGTFGDAAAEMPNETEVEVPLHEQSGTETEDELRVSDFIEEGAPLEPSDLAAIEGALQERTADLQRLQAEFLNYKRRVDRDRDLIRENATYAALAPITEVLDNIDRAKEHGPLDDGFKAVAEQLERTVASLGLIKFGTVGDAFDPNVHEALSHIGQDPEVTVTTCKVIAKSGYKIGDRVVRAAQVLVVDPADQ